MPRPKAPHGTTQRWRNGCRCDACLDAHNLDTRDRRRVASAAQLDLIAANLVSRLAAGDPFAQVARDLGTTPTAIHGRASWDPAWAALIDAALIAGRDPLLNHGSASAYRHGRCRCPECRQFHTSSQA